MIGNLIKSKANIYLLGGFYVLAGLNHFIHPEFYYDLIPDYFLLIEEINFLSGLTEIALGLAIFNRKTRKYAAYGIVLLLLLFIPSHIYFIQIGGCVEGGLCVAPWIAWVRLLLIHPLLMLWALSVRSL